MGRWPYPVEILEVLLRTARSLHLPAANHPSAVIFESTDLGESADARKLPLRVYAMLCRAREPGKHGGAHASRGRPVVAAPPRHDAMTLLRGAFHGNPHEL